MRRTVVTLTLLAAAGVLAAGCGGKAGSGGSGAGGAPATTAAPSATGGGGYGGGPTSTGAAAPASGTAVAIANFAFSPATREAKVGQQVTWTNRQGVAHTVTADGGAFTIRCRRGRRSRSPSPRRAASPTTA